MARNSGKSFANKGFRARLIAHRKIGSLEMYEEETDARCFDACHIMPKAVDRDEPDNGLLLTPSHHRAFDKGWLSFDHRGYAMVPDKFGFWDILESLGILDPVNRHGMRLRHRDRATMKRIKWHRENVFVG